MTTWIMNNAEGTAVGPSVPVIADDVLAATLTALWADDDGVRVSIDWHVADDLSASAAAELAGALWALARLTGPA